MSEFNKHIQSKSSSLEKIETHSIEKDKRQKEETASPQNASSYVQLCSALALYFEKIFTFFHTRRSAPAPTQDTLNALLALRKSLVMLAGKDLSHDPEFNQQLARVWHTLLDHCNPPFSSSHKINFLILQIKNFPLGSEHSLGYYLAHHAGEHWIPFPFMELLYTLHQEFCTSPSNSSLRHWIFLLDDILLCSSRS